MPTPRGGQGSNQYQTRPGSNGVILSRSAPAHTRLSRSAQESGAAHHEQLTGLLVNADAEKALTAAWKHGALRRLVPELVELEKLGTGIDGHRHKDQLTHTFKVVGQCPPGNQRVRLAALFHDIAKPQTRQLRGGEVTFWYHEEKGAEIAENRMNALGYDTPLPEDVATMVRMSGQHKGSDGWTDAAVRRFVSDAGDLLPDLLALYRADCTTRHPEKFQAVQDQVTRLEARIAEVQAKDSERSRRPVVNGEAVMSRYEIGPGHEVGRLLKGLLDHQKSRGDDLTEEEAWVFLDALHSTGT